MNVARHPKVGALGQPEDGEGSGRRIRDGGDTCIPVFIATLFTIARTWKLGHGKYPLPDERIRKLWYIYTMECVLVTQSCQTLRSLEL